MDDLEAWTMDDGAAPLALSTSKKRIPVSSEVMVDASMDIDSFRRRLAVLAVSRRSAATEEDHASGRRCQRYSDDNGAFNNAQMSQSQESLRVRGEAFGSPR